MSIYDKLGAKTAGIRARTVGKSPDRTARSAPGMLLNATQRIDAAEARVAELEAKLAQAQAQGGKALLVPLSKLKKVAGRQRRLTDGEYAELRENLRQNEMVHPIVVEPLDDDGLYPIVSGHNRVDIYEELGRKEIPLLVKEPGSLGADLAAFYANLFQPALPDYEKYLGFTMIKRRHQEMSHEQIADMAGISRSQLTKLMAFGNLPPEVMEILEERSGILGATAAQEMSSAVTNGRSRQVVEAVRALAVGSIDQAQAVRMALAKEPTPQRPKPSTTTIRAGKATFCSYRRVVKSIRMDFKNEDDAAAVEEALEAFLSAKAKNV